MNEKTMRKHYETTPKEILIDILISSRLDYDKMRYKNKECKLEIERLNNKNKELYDDLKTLWIVLWNMDTEMTGYQNEVFDKYYDEFYKGSDKE